MARVIVVFVFLMSSFVSPWIYAADAENWLAKLQSELPPAVAQRFRSRENVQCRATTLKEGAVTIDEIAVKEGNMCYVRSRGNSNEKQVMVFTPAHCFRLHSDPSGSVFTINRITEPKNNPDYLTKTRFPFQLAIHDTLFADSYIKDVRVDELIRLGPVRHVETLPDADFGELAKFEVDLSQDEGNSKRVNAAYPISSVGLETMDSRI